MEPVSIDNTAQEPLPQVSIDIGGAGTFVPPDIASHRAVRAQYGLSGILGKSHQEIFQEIVNGNEESLRKRTAMEMDLNRNTQLEQTLLGVAKRKGGSLTREEVDYVGKQIEVNKSFTDPKSVFEQAFAQKYLDTMGWVRKDNYGSWLQDAQREIPQYVQATDNVASDLITKRQYLINKKELAGQEVSKMGWLPWVGQQAKTLVPFYYELMMRDNVPGVNMLKGLLGMNLEDQSRELFRKNNKEFIDLVDTIHENLKKDNPVVAHAFLEAMVGQSTSEGVVNDLFTILDLTVLGPVAKRVFNRLKLINMDRQAKKDLIKSLEATDPVPKEDPFPMPTGTLPKEGEAFGMPGTLRAQLDETTFGPQGQGEGYWPSGTGTARARTVIEEPPHPDVSSDMYRAFVDSGEMEAHQPIRVAAASGAGDLETAAVEKVTANIVSKVSGTSTGADQVKEILEALPSALRADKVQIAADPGRYGREIVNRITEAYDRFEGQFMKAIQEIARVQRIPAIMATKSAIQSLKDEVRGQFPGLHNSILEVGDPFKIKATNTWHIPIRIGEFTGEYWHTPEAARAFADLNGIANANVKSHGMGFYVEVIKPLDETQDIIRDGLLATKNAKTPDSWLASTLGRLRTPDETLSLDQRINRKIATYTASVLMDIAKQNSKQIRDTYSRFRGKDFYEVYQNWGNWRDWERTIREGRNIVGPDGKKGYFFESPGQLETFYQQNFKRMPDASEIEAYFAFKRNIEMDRMLRNIALYRNMSRVGAESHSFSLLDPKTGERVASPFFSGVRRTTFPGGDDTVLITGRYVGDEKVVLTSSTMDARFQKDLTEGVKEGRYKLVEIYDPETRPLEGFGNEIQGKRIRYVLSPSMETKPISFDQIPRRGGGHIEYDYDHYIKQAKVREQNISGQFHNWYEGDTTIMPMMNRKMARDVAEKMDVVRLHLQRGDEAAAELAGKELPIPWREHRSWYDGTIGPNGQKIAPRLSVNEPIRVTDKNRLIGDMDNELMKRYGDTFRDGTRRGSLARQYQVEYTGERDAFEIFTINDKGTRHNPLYGYEHAEFVDPITTMNRALSKITNSTFMDDYKIFAVEHWLESAKKFLNVKGGEPELRHSPFYHFNNPDWKSGTPENVKNAFLNDWMKIRQFYGIPSRTQAELHSMSQNLADSIYSKYGPATPHETFDWGKAGSTGLIGAMRSPSTVKLLPSWALARATDPVDFFRSLAYHSTIGLFSHVQILVQSMTYATIAGIAGPRFATTGAYGALLHQWTRINPSMLDAADRWASKLNLGGPRWRPGEFKEAMELLKRTGFENVGQEHALVDHGMTPKVVSSVGHDFLDAGTLFFRGAERNMRYGAWYTAYREFRDGGGGKMNWKAHPTGRVTDEELGQIFERAEMLSGNMSKASRATWQDGIASIPTQFLSYQLRLMEQFTGKRLTWQERARLLTTYGSLFGIPTTFGISGIPFGDILRKYALENNYVVGDKWYQTAIMEGIPSLTIGLITGKGDLSKGTYLNIGHRLGAPGFDQIREVLVGDKPWWRLFGGASWSTLSGMWEAGDGFRTAMGSMIRGDGKSFPLTPNDFMAPLKQIASVSNGMRAYAAVQTGRYMSRNETLMQTDVPTTQALFMYATGLQSQRIEDTSIMTWSLKNKEELEKYATKQYLKEMQRAWMAGAANDPEQRHNFLKRAQTWLEISGFPDEKRSMLVGLASDQSKSLIVRQDHKFYLEQVPRAAKEGKLKAWGTIQRQGQ